MSSKDSKPTADTSDGAVAVPSDAALNAPADPTSTSGQPETEGSGKAASAVMPGKPKGAAKSAVARTMAPSQAAVSDPPSTTARQPTPSSAAPAAHERREEAPGQPVTEPAKRVTPSAPLAAEPRPSPPSLTSSLPAASASTAGKADDAAAALSRRAANISAPAVASPTLPPSRPQGQPERLETLRAPEASAATPAVEAPRVEDSPKAPPVAMSILAPDREVSAVLAAEHGDPFSFLGMHAVAPNGPLVVRAFLPGVSAVAVIDATTGKMVGPLEKVRAEGLFVGAVASTSGKPFPYRLKLTTEKGERIVDDAYRFPPLLNETDEKRLAQGNDRRAYDRLGAHPMMIDGVAGTAFAVWAPHAARVAVIGAFNGWDGRCHGMRKRHGCGVWEIFVPAVGAGELYKFEIKTSTGIRLTDKTDPFAFHVERGPGIAAIVTDLSRYRWGDAEWLERRRSFDARMQPVSIYEVHLGSWRRNPEEGHRWLTYRELAEQLPEYVADLGFTHVELLPVNEYDFEPSLGYQPLVPFAPTSRWGSPADFAFFVDRCHQAGVGVILDWIPHGFSNNPHGLREFDGSTLFEAADPQRRYVPGTSALAYEFGRPEVAAFLLANAHFWFDRYHLDGLRVPELPKMLYLDFARGHGEWTPNRFGGHEHLEAVDLIRRFNEQVYEDFPGIFTVAEDPSAWPRVSHPTFLGGLGFGFRWNAPWVRDSLRYMARNAIHRKYYHDELTYGPSTAFQENFVLALSHEEVSFGKGSLLRRMPGDRWQKFANLRAYYGLMFAHPGKKLLFMGNEFAQDREWNSDISLDWHLLADPLHAGMQRLIRDLNNLYRTLPAMHQLDCEPSGFAWIDCNDSDQSVISFLRQPRDGKGFCVIVSNFTPVIRENYRVGVPEGGFYAERLNTDAAVYGGTNAGSAGGVTAIPESMHGRPFSLPLRLPPLATVILQHSG
jgi:1,4-alpha-glucan branching enzyme